MSPKRMMCLLLASTLSLTAIGCGSGEGGMFGFMSKKDSGTKTASRSRSRSRTKRKSATASDKREIDDMSPELSMSRDLNQLRERERAQAKKVEEMRTSLSQGRDIVDQEEQKLRQIQGKISDYDSQMRRYERVSTTSYKDDTFNVPASMYEEPRGRREPTRREAQPGRNIPASYDYEDNRGYSRDSRPTQQRNGGGNRGDRYDSRDSRESREVMVFDGRPGAQNDYQPARQPARQSTDNYAEFDNPFSAPQGRQQQRSAPPPARRAADDETWNVPSTGIYSNSPKSGPVAMPNRGQSTSQSQPKQSAPAPTTRPASNPVSVSSGASYDEEVFSPDMYLGR